MVAVTPQDEPSIDPEFDLALEQRRIHEQPDGQNSDSSHGFLPFWSRMDQVTRGTHD